MLGIIILLCAGSGYIGGIFFERENVFKHKEGDR